MNNSTLYNFNYFKLLSLLNDYFNIPEGIMRVYTYQNSILVDKKKMTKALAITSSKITASIIYAWVPN